MGEEERPVEPPPEGPDGEERQASEEELRARLEEQLRKVRVQDVLLESVASILNLSARRIAKEDERDLEQAKVGIDAVRAVVDLLDEEPAQQVRNALSEVQMLYARQSGEGGQPQQEAAPEEGQAPSEAPPASGRGGRSGLWTPPGA
jgi:hypothetical protein